MLRDRVLPWFGPRRQGPVPAYRPRRPRAVRTGLEPLEGRALLSATSAVAWTVGGVTHTALYAIGKSDAVEVSVDGGGFTSLGGYAKQVSAGLDVLNRPEVYVIGADNAVWVDKGSGFVSLGGYAKAISATVENTVYAIGTNDDIFVGHGTPGLGFFDSGLKARQISAGTDVIGNPEVYAIGFDNHVYAGNGSGGPGGFANWGGYARQISATVGATVYAIGPDNAVYKDHGSGGGTGWVSLGGYAKEISAGVDGTFGPYVFAIGLNDGLWSNHGSGWVSLGGYVTDVSGTSIASFGVHPAADLAYVVSKGHVALLHQGTGFTTVGGYVQTPSGSADNDANTWEPATRDVSAVSYASISIHRVPPHSALYAIAPDDSVEVSVDGAAFKSLGGYAKQVSAGLVNPATPEVYVIGADNAVWVDKGSGFVSLGGYFKEISATVQNTVYAIGTDDAVWVNHGSGWTRLGLAVKQISAGADVSGNAEVFAIGFDDAVYRITASGAVANLGGYAKQISATMNNTVYAIGGDNAVYENTGSGWVSLGGYVKQIGASINFTGQPEVFAIGLNDGLLVNQGTGWFALGSTYVLEVAAPAVGVGLSGDLAYAVAQRHGGLMHSVSTFSPISGGTIE
jgi:hypothetical protein